MIPLMSDPIFNLIFQEEQRQKTTLQLIPSENICSVNVRRAVESILSNKYSEGYPHKRYYEGNELIDEIELLAIERAKKIFGVPHANVQPYSGSPANVAIQLAILEKNDCMMGMKLSSGGHLTHGHPVNFSGKLYKCIQYPVDPKTELLDYDEIKKQIGVISECKANSESIKDCIDGINSDDNPFIWEIGCDKGAEKVLYGFAEFFQDCIDSEDNNCLCRKNLETSKEDIAKYGLSGIPQYDLELVEKSTNEIQVIFKKPSIDLSYSVNTNGIPIWFPNRYIATYSKNELLTLELTFQDRIDKNIEYGYAFPKQRKIILYRNDNNPQKIKAIDFVKQEGDALLYPNGKPVVDENKNPVNANNIPLCNINQKNIHRFCVTKKDSEVIAYDAVDKQVKGRNITIKFAAYIP